MSESLIDELADETLSNSDRIAVLEGRLDLAARVVVLEETVRLLVDHVAYVRALGPVADAIARDHDLRRRLSGPDAKHYAHRRGEVVPVDDPAYRERG